MHQRQQESTLVYSDQRKRRKLEQRFYGSNGVLTDDRIRNTIIEDHRRTTAAIIATTNTVAEAAENFRQFFESNSDDLGSAGEDNRERSEELEGNTNIIRENTEAISIARTQYSNLYPANQWQSPRDEPDYNQQRRSAGENLNRTAFSLVAIDQSSAEFARNLRDVEKNLAQIKEYQKEVKKLLPKPDKGIYFKM